MADAHSDGTPIYPRSHTLPTPDLLTVIETASILRISRTTAYELVRRDLATDGGEGLGVVRIGGQLRVPRASIERLIGAPVTLAQPARTRPTSHSEPAHAPAGSTLPFPS